MKQVCPNCGEKMKNESLGFKCTKCKGFIDLQSGKFFDNKQTPFMPPKTNFDKITESVESLAGVLKGISDCRWINCHECPLSAVNCSSITSIKEWLQKECE